MTKPTNRPATDTRAELIEHARRCGLSLVKARKWAAEQLKPQRRRPAPPEPTMPLFATTEER